MLKELFDILDVGNLGIMICFMMGILVNIFFYLILIGDEFIVKCFMKCVIGLFCDMNIYLDG